MTITIIGSGKVGASAALNCGLRELGDVVLLDVVQGLPQGEAYGYKPSASQREASTVLSEEVMIIKICKDQML